MRDRLTYDTPHGEGHILQRRADSPWAALVLTHGAGGGIDASDLVALQAALPPRGISVALVEMPWRRAGRKIASAPPVLDESFVSLADHLRPRSPMFVGGRSAGARVGCRTGRRLGAVGVVALAFPLHPPGRPDKSRAGELAAARLPVLVVQGERDPFGAPAEFPIGPVVEVVAAADHSLRVPKRAPISQSQATAQIVEHVHAFITARLRH